MLRAKTAFGRMTALQSKAIRFILPETGKKKQPELILSIGTRIKARPNRIFSYF
jgi:hypothetical protein